MRILLINPPSAAIYQAFMPLGLAYIAGSLLRHGHEITVWDVNAEKWSKDEVIKKIKETEGAFQLVGITALGGDYPYTKWITETFRQLHQGIKIILGGYLASALPEFVMDHLPVDFVAVGEAEDTIVELVDKITNKGDLSNIRGIYLRDHSHKVMTTPPRARLKSMDQLPLPPWEHFPMDVYLHDQHPDLVYGSGDDGDGLVSIMASRGCPFDCIYCDHTIKGHKPRYRPVKSVIDEIKVLLTKYGDTIKVFYFWDDILVWDRGWISEFCESLHREKIEISWTCNAHVKKVEPRLMARIKDAGCVNIRFGIESGSQGILDSLHKGVKVENALESMRVCLDAGLNLTIYIMVGMTGENHETIDETIEFFRKLIRPSYVFQISRIHFFILTPFAGTRLFEKVKKDGLISDVDEFLQRGFDAYHDIPLNISGQSDSDLIKLKKRLEEGVSLIFQEEINRLYSLLFDMHGECGRDIQ
ncbi:MAG: B12-binding domain-containing radical SAM protein [Deltaproteobacteria bacterium]|nr:B12-binding domain-containing radical SAM protein [Deltaproteobacteria bacterium]MBW2117684.1 B12-binding domain-containing radical SAM protein [Deltaproteobacteria bacterium]MBW2344829.1 B12-binding domain-containing radical SAM protein [Deltaproteobacteria bacterium]